VRAIVAVALIACGTAPPAVPVTPIPIAEPPLAPACRGDRFDARELVAKTDCVSNRGSNANVIENASQLPAAIALSVDPNTFSLVGGTTSEAALIMTNTSSAEVVLSLFTGCTDLAAVESEIDGADGERVDSDRESMECAFGAGVCGTSIVTVALAPGGTIRAPFTVDARRRTFQPCVEKRVGKVAAGSYMLRVLGMANLADLRVPIRIR
jgi:hypothetical protein